MAGQCSPERRTGPTAAWFRSEFNSGYPVDRNNGSLWGGRGFNMVMSAGGLLRAGPLSVAIQPEITFQQNDGFVLRPTPDTISEFGDPYYGARLDLPQRFGDDSFWSLWPGQSYARIDVRAVGLGITTENVWWGAGQREAILFSTTASGFPHAFVETVRPVDVWLGDLSVSAIWGQLRESEYFDTIASNDKRMITGLGVGLQPRGLENLYIGFMRTYTFHSDSLSFRHFVPFFEPLLKEDLVTGENPRGNDPFDDQRLSVLFRWTLPENDFEVYGEFAREDHSWDWQDLVQELDHSAAYLVGLRKLHALSPDRYLDIRAEWTNLQQVRANRPGVRRTARFYVHAPQGHTHRGQMLGAGIGSGSEAQYVGLDVLTERSSIGGFIERVRRNEMSDVAMAARTVWPPRHDVELTGGLRAGWTRGSMAINAQASYSYRLNRDWIEDASNWRLVVQTQWQPQASRPGTP